jgi:hypothetical protein
MRRCRQGHGPRVRHSPHTHVPPCLFCNILRRCCAVRLSILVGPDDNVSMLSPMAEWVLANAACPAATAALQKVATLRKNNGPFARFSLRHCVRALSALQAVKRAKADAAAVDPGRVCNLACAVLCGLCDAAATGRWLQQHLDAALLLLSCVPAASFATAAPYVTHLPSVCFCHILHRYCCKLATLLAPRHSAAGSSVAAAAAALAEKGAEEQLPKLLQTARCCLAAAADGKRAIPVDFSGCFCCSVSLRSSVRRW